MIEADADVLSKFCKRIFEVTADDSNTTSIIIDHASLATRQQSLRSIGLIRLALKLVMVNELQLV